jgi:hypothetical protein
MPDLAELVHERSGVLEYDERNRTLVWTDRLTAKEYGASAVVAVAVLPWFGRLIADAANPRPDPLIPQWEMCKTCGGDHWTKDHPLPGSDWTDPKG